MAADFAETNKILSAPESADPSDVVSNIESWKTSLAPLGAAGENIVADLDELQTLLTSGSPDGSKIGPLMTRLGEATTEVADGNSELEALGRKLSALGS